MAGLGVDGPQAPGLESALATLRGNHSTEGGKARNSKR